MGRYKNSGLGKGIGTSPQINLENEEYENKIIKIHEMNFSNKSKREELLEKVTNENLKNTIKELYRENATIGDGGTADAIRHELETGELVGGKSHIQKGEQRLKNLQNILKRNNLNEIDRKIANELYNDLLDALGGNKNDK